MTKVAPLFFNLLSPRALIWLSFFICQLAEAYAVVDDRGVLITFENPPTKIVSLLPSLSESVCTLKSCSELIGVDDHSNFPNEINSLVRVGSGLNPNLELIASLKPDLILISKNNRAADALQSLGFKVFVFETNSYEDFKRAFKNLGLILKTANAEMILSSIDEELAKVSMDLPHTLKGPQGLRVYFEIYTGPYAASESSFIGETISRLGLNNVVPKSLGAFPKLNPEFVVKANPDFIFVNQSDYENLISRPGWRFIKAVKEKRVCGLTKIEADILTRPGPRLAQAGRILVNCILRTRSMN